MIAIINGTKNMKISDILNESSNFTADDIKHIETMRDLGQMKLYAKQLISKRSDKPMKPQKVAWFSQAIDSKKHPADLIKLMYDLLLAGEGNAVFGQRYTTDPNSYRKSFSEARIMAKDVLPGGDLEVSQHFMDRAVERRLSPATVAAMFMAAGRMAKDELEQVPADTVVVLVDPTSTAIPLAKVERPDGSIYWSARTIIPNWDSKTSKMKYQVIKIPRPVVNKPAYLQPAA